jgi:hypothetical protein
MSSVGNEIDKYRYNWTNGLSRMTDEKRPERILQYTAKGRRELGDVGKVECVCEVGTGLIDYTVKRRRRRRRRRRVCFI